MRKRYCLNRVIFFDIARYVLWKPTRYTFFYFYSETNTGVSFRLRGNPLRDTTYRKWSCTLSVWPELLMWNRYLTLFGPLGPYLNVVKLARWDKQKLYMMFYSMATVWSKEAPSSLKRKNVIMGEIWRCWLYPKKIFAFCISDTCIYPD